MGRKRTKTQASGHETDSGDEGTSKKSRKADNKVN